MHRRLQWKQYSASFGSDLNSRILVELLSAHGDPRLARRLLRRFNKVMTLVHVLRRNIDDRVQRAWLERLLLDDTRRKVGAQAPPEIAQRFYARVRRAVNAPQFR
jgi:hypothetical protein